MIITKKTGNTISIIDDDNNKTMLVLDIIKDKTKTTFVVSGSLKTHVASSFTDVIMNTLQNVGQLVLDFADVPYVASAGLRALLTAQQYVDDTDDGTDIIITNINDEVREVFESTGFINILNVQD